MALPDSVKYLVIGAGIHGLSTAYHLAKQLKARGQGSGADILVVDKTAIAAGASGIASGVVRNNYYQPAMRELMAHCVDIWEQHAETLSYHPVGYMQISPECMHEQVGMIYEQQQAIGYSSVFVEGAGDCDRYMQAMLPDWQAQGITSVLHEKKGGYANNTKSIYGLAGLAKAEGVRIVTGLKVIGFERANGASSAARAVVTDRGRIACDQVVVGSGHGSSRSGTCWTCRRPSRSGVATARCMTACRCGPTGLCRRVPWAWTPGCSAPATAGRRQ
jgi:methylglutamate dehydrogenase subunit A